MLRGEGVAVSDTPFPRPIYQEQRDYYDDIGDWFNKCMEDFPTCVDGIHVTPDGRALPATLDVPIEVTAWFNKWFSQFVEDA